MCSDTGDGDYTAESWFKQKEMRENYVLMKKKFKYRKGMVSFLIF